MGSPVPGQPTRPHTHTLTALYPAHQGSLRSRGSHCYRYTGTYLCVCECMCVVCVLTRMCSDLSSRIPGSQSSPTDHSIGSWNSSFQVQAVLLCDACSSPAVQRQLGSSKSLGDRKAGDQLSTSMCPAFLSSPQTIGLSSNSLNLCKTPQSWPCGWLKGKAWPHRFDPWYCLCT